MANLSENNLLSSGDSLENSYDAVRHTGVPGLRRVYRFTVISLSILLLAMAIWRPSPSGHVAQVLLHHQEADPATMPPLASLGATERIVGGPSLVHDWFQDGRHLRQVAIRWAQSADSPLSHQTQEDRVAWADQFVARLSYLVQTNGRGETRIAVRAIDTEPSRAVWALQSLADQFVAEHLSASDMAGIADRIGSLDRETRVVNRQVQSAREDLREFVHSRLQARRESFAALSEQAAALVKASASDQRQGPQTINPQWQSLRDKLVRIEQEYHDLSTTRTSEHPELAIRLDQIARLKEELAQTPCYLELSTPEEARPTDTGTVAATDALASLAVETEFDEESVRREIELTSDYRNWYATLSAAEEHQRRLQRDRSQLPSNALLLQGSVGVGASPRLIHAINGRYTPLQFLGLVFLGVVVGLVFALWPTRILQPPVMYSVQDAADTLGLPVIGAVACPGGEAAPELKVGRPMPAAWTATRLSELVLASVVLLMFVLLLGDGGFGGQLLRDPFAAYTSAVDGVIHWLI